MPLEVFYLDDEPALCECFSDEFSSDEIQVKTFTDPELAVAEAEKCPPDLIFLDRRFPGITGDQVAQVMDAAIPKYLVTGDITVELSHGFVSVLQKPVNTEYVREVLESMLKLSRLNV